MKKKLFSLRTLIVAIFALVALFAIGRPAHAADIIAIDGSSTVYPITEAVAEEFGAVNRSARITVGVSGSGGGFKKFCRGETDISNASRPIKQKEIDLCKKNGVEFIELPIAYDGLAVVIHPSNKWAETITVAELKTLWEPKAQAKITKWNQVRSEWPNKKIKLFGPGVDSGTFDYFTEAIVGKAQASRGDFTSSEDDNVLVLGVAADKYALGFFGLAYYQENRDKLKVVGIDNGSATVKPSPKTVENGSYTPLSRPLFIYVRKDSVKRPEVDKFLEFYLKEGPALAREVGYISLPSDIMSVVTKKYRKRVAKSIYGGKPSVGKSLKSLLKDSLK